MDQILSPCFIMDQLIIPIYIYVYIYICHSILLYIYIYIPHVSSNNSPFITENPSSSSMIFPSKHIHVVGRFPMAEEYYPTWQRQRLLLHGFNFHCRCERCCGFETPELCCAFRCPECEVGLVGWLGGWEFGWLGGLEEIFF